MRIFREVLGVAWGIGLLIAAGCGGSDGSITAHPTPTPTPGPTGLNAIMARAYASGSATAPGDPAPAHVQVTWQVPSDISVNDVLEYHIYRDGAIIGVTTRTHTNFIDSMGPPIFPNVTYNRPTSTVTGGTPGGTTGGTGSGSPVGTQSSLEAITVSIPLLEVGVPHRYSVSALYQIAVNGGLIQYSETSVATSGTVTPTVRPDVSGPTTKQNLHSVRVAFQPVRGADQYIFEFATDMSFGNKVTRGPFSFGSTPETQQSSAFDLSRDFTKTTSATKIYIRVGARNSHDTLSPIPINTPNGDNYIYSLSGIFFTP